MTHKLEADSVQLQFHRRTILSDIYVKCESGKITGLLGRNGQGKSCLMKIIYGNLKCENSVRIDDVTQLEGYKKPGVLSYLPQFNFIPKPLRLKRIFNDFDLAYSTFEKRFPGFASKYNSRIGSLSGGEHRLVEIYVIVRSPSYFAMLDEPFTHLNPIQIEDVKELLLEEKSTKGLLITDHMFKPVTEISDSLYVLKEGKTYLAKTMEDIQELGYARV